MKRASKPSRTGALSWKKDLSIIKRLRAKKDAPVDSIGCERLADVRASRRTYEWQCLVAAMFIFPDQRSSHGCCNGSFAETWQHGGENRCHIRSEAVEANQCSWLLQREGQDLEGCGEGVPFRLQRLDTPDHGRIALTAGHWSQNGTLGDAQCLQSPSRHLRGHARASDCQQAPLGQEQDS